MAEIGQILRHRSPSTTEISAKVDIDGLRSNRSPMAYSRRGKMSALSPAVDQYLEIRRALGTASPVR